MSYVQGRTLREKLRVGDASWDYKEVDTSWGVHGLHPYPAMMIFPVVRRLLLEFSKEQDIILDPFMGSGTVLVESLLHNRFSYGVDINPLAILIAKAKTTPLKTKELIDEMQDILHRRTKIQRTNRHFFNIDYWFKDGVAKALNDLLTRIESIEKEEIRTFFKVAFSETARVCSNTKTGEFKLVRIKELEKHNPNVFNKFKKIALRNISKIGETYRQNPETWVKIMECDARKPLPIEENSVSLILTSPPYGDSKTTVAYGQFSRLALQWLGCEELKIDQESLGGVLRPTQQYDLPSGTLKKTLSQIGAKDKRRAREVLSFFVDLFESFKNLIPQVKWGGHICIVIGNRRVKQVTIPTDIIIAELSEAMGLAHIRTFIRAISNKRMPRLNSPTNVEGMTETTMNEEYIVILRKDRL